MKMWEIREEDSHKPSRFGGYKERDGYYYGSRGHMGMKDHDDAYEEGYECGYEDGYAKAMKDTFYSHSEKDSYSERRMSR